MYNFVLAGDELYLEIVQQVGGSPTSGTLYKASRLGVFMTATTVTDRLTSSALQAKQKLDFGHSATVDTQVSQTCLLCISRA